MQPLYAQVYRRLSLPALRALLAARRHAPPLLIGGPAPSPSSSPSAAASSAADAAARDVPPLPSYLHGLAVERRTLRAAGDRPSAFPTAVLHFAADQAQLSAEDFRQLPARRSGADAPPRPLYASTASQIGLLPTPGIPDLPRALLPQGAPAACVALLRRWLLLPPRPSVADAMQEACVEMAGLSDAAPSPRPLPVGKLVGLLLARQAGTDSNRQ